MIRNEKKLTVRFTGTNVSVGADEAECRNLFASFAGHVVHLSTVDTVEEAGVLRAPLPGGHEELALGRGLTLRTGNVPWDANGKNGGL